MEILRVVDAEADTGEFIQDASQAFLSTYSPPRIHHVKQQINRCMQHMVERELDYNERLGRAIFH